ncbi:transcriptional regulator [Paracidovorax citrulli]|uniref:transcriptional regulator n=1 Tax=Paracidovorax citrulli TaxID=80869 RepID=UPI003FA70CB5
MRVSVESVENVGMAIRAVRKVNGIRQDDVPGVSHVFLRDLEKGKDTVQFGRVLKVLNELGIRMVLEVPTSQGEVIKRVMERFAAKSHEASRRTITPESE